MRMPHTGRNGIGWRGIMYGSAHAETATGVKGQAGFCARVGIAPETLCVETLDYPFSLVADDLAEAGISVCLDVGHVILHGHDLRQYLDAYLPRARVVHLHGGIDGRGHLPIDALPAGTVEALVEGLARARGERILTIEVFARDHLASSLETLRRMHL